MSAAASLTPAQQAAVTAGGDVLLVAAAGSGKTSTLVQRCLDRLLQADDPVSLEEVLLVTFTEAAAAEMRQRIRSGLERRLNASPGDARLAEQLALLDTAAISTLHGFCLRLVREHFYDLQLDPQLTVLDEAQAGLLADEALDRLLQRHYSGATPADEAVRELILTQGDGHDEALRRLVRRLHDYTQTLADPDGWHREQRAALGDDGPSRWEQWLLKCLGDWRKDWLAALEPLAADNPKAGECRECLRQLPASFTRAQAARQLECILAADEHWERGTKGKLRPPLKRLFEEAAFLQDVTRPSKDEPDPLVEDFTWVRPHLETLLRLTAEFTAEFARAKREAGGVDFHDLEQFALQLLWDRASGRPTAIARQWRQRLRFVFVDEYQDINAAQDLIITALSREPAGNRFLVGDVKQSIYRFRLADPRIIVARERQWRAAAPGAQVLALSENFRSHERLLQFINPVFTALLHEEVGGVGYPPEARLRYGAPAARPELTAASDPAPRVELHLRLTGGDEPPLTDDNGDELLAELSDIEHEARLLARRLRELKESQTKIWRGREQGWQPVDYRDMVVLLRARSGGKAECFAREFARQGVPLEVARGGFYESIEISDLLRLLQLLDNPLQDVPALAVLRSPLVGLTLDELAVIRLARPRGWFWLAVLTFHREAAHLRERLAGDVLRAAVDSARPKVDAFLQSFGRWRQLARQGALSHCLETMLDETRYEDWLLSLPHGEQRRANVARLLVLTRQFDPFQRQGLFRFLKFVEAQAEAGASPDAAPGPETNAVRLMTIHQSKGCEFPVVAVANLGGRFNFNDLKAGIILDEEFGVCAIVKPPGDGPAYPSLPHWLARRRQRRETIGEELRLFYVALTRAQDRLILTGTATQKRARERWSGPAVTRLGPRELIESNCPLDWLGPLLPGLTGKPGWANCAQGQAETLTWRVWTEAAAPAPVTAEQAAARPEWKPGALEESWQRLKWEYPWLAATREPAKSSVSALRRRREAELAEEARPWFAARAGLGRGARGRLSAAEIGTAHHLLLQLAEWAELNDETKLRAAADRLTEAGVLSPEQAAALKLPAVAAFWNSAVGRQVLAVPAANRHRELPFTARFNPAELAELDPALGAKLPPEEFIVVQGFADLAVILPEEIWLLDFKTDQFKPEQLDTKKAEHAPQVRLYAAALERIYRRPVRQQWLHFLAVGQTCEL
jgi:ATP-dependent helicase/nuclease subunit A